MSVGPLRRLARWLRGHRDTADLDWREFEERVAQAYRRLGWDVEPAGGARADGGIDLIARDDDETLIIQCKHWPQRSVGVGVVRELFGVMTAEGADGAALVTSGRPSAAARAFCEGKPLELVDGDDLAKLLEG